MYTDLMESYFQTKEDKVIQATAAQWEKDQDKRYKELYEFIDDFVNSQEYEDYLTNKRNLMRTDEGTQCGEPTELSEQKAKSAASYPLTARSKKMFVFITRFQEYIKNQKIAETLNKQMNSINIIKHKIYQVTKYSLLYAQDLKIRNEKLYKDIIEDFCEMLQIDCAKVKTKNRKSAEARERIISFSKILKTRFMNRRQRYANIARKLTKEIKQSKQLLVKSRIAYPRKIKRKKKKNVQSSKVAEVDFKVQIKIRKFAPITERPIKLKHHGETNLNNKLKADLENDDWSRISSSAFISKDTSATGKQGKDAVKKKKSKDYSTSIYPIPEIINTRHKLTADEIKNMSFLMSEFQTFDDIMEVRYLARTEVKTDAFELDKYFIYKPKTIFFNNYAAGKTYHRMLKIQNTSFQSRKFRFVKITTMDDDDSILFSLSQLIGIQKMIPGSSINLFLTFNPVTDDSKVDATLEFLSFDKKTLSYQKFYVDVCCTPKLIDFKISSDNVFFGKIPIWQKKSGFKTITLTNDGALPCRIIIRKIKDALEVEEDEYVEIKDESSDITDVLNDILESVFYFFGFDRTCVKLPKSSSYPLKIQMKNFEYIGNYIEEYALEVYNYSHEFIGSHDIFLSGEVIPHFIHMSPDILDFGICIINSIYQVKLDIENTSSSTQALSLKYPSAIAPYIRVDVCNIILPRHTTRRLWIKLLPSKSIKDCIFFNQLLSLLEFPIYVYVLTNNHTDITPARATCYAVITSAFNFDIKTTCEAATQRFEDEIYLNLGSCTIFETVTTDIILENKTLAYQIYGFLDLPKCITLTPNYGFGGLEPGAQQIIKLHFHPDYHILLKKMNEEMYKDYTMQFKISFDTLCNIRHLKKAIDMKKFRSSIKLVLSEIRRPVNKKLEEDINECVQAIKDELFGTEEVVERYLEEIVEYGEEQSEVMDELPLKDSFPIRISIKTTVIKPLVEISAQYIEFPDTPCNSYSSVGFLIKALQYEFSEETVFLKKKDLKLPKYEAWFKITGDNEEIRIEPSCGILRNGEIRQCFTIAQPKVPTELVRNLATSIKYVDIYHLKMNEIGLSHKKNRVTEISEDNKEEGKKERRVSKLNGSKLSVKARESIKFIQKEEIEFDPRVILSDSELVLNPEDYFPAEMCYWRCLQPYTIRSNLTCIINYESKHFERPKEIINMTAVCRVIKPDFIINLKSQRINFGKTCIGIKATKYLMIQNINYNHIEVRLSTLNPTGPFQIIYSKRRVIPAEGFLKLPIHFEPTEESQVIMEDKKIWTLVEFEKEGTVADVPTSWLVETEEYLCPSFTNAIKSHDALNTCLPTFKVKIFRNKNQRLTE